MSSAHMPRATYATRLFRGATYWLSLVSLMGLALFANNAGAACSAFQPPPELYVGNMSSDSACTQNTIQAAIDAATCIYGTNIYITHEQTYSAQHLTISGKNVNLIGRVSGDVCGPASPPICNPTCPPAPTSPRVSISGHNGDAVLTISGNSTVTLRYMDISGGQQASGFSGGGVEYIGSGSLTLDTSWVRGNHAANGGGVYFNGTGSTTSTLNVLANTEILSNIVDGSGGGILIEGNALLNVLQPQTVIEFNHADSGHGGGIAVIGPAQANIGSPGVIGVSGTIEVVSNNTAAYGGGISITAPGGDLNSAKVRLFTTDSTHPVGITNNTASQTGGGIYLKSHNGDATGPYNFASVCAWDFRIGNNIAQEGAAIYADVDSGPFDDTGSLVYMGGCPNDGFPSALGAVRCTNSDACNSINDNQAVDPTQGSAILIQDKGFLDASRFAMRNNHVAHAIRIVGYTQRDFISDCLLANNQSAHELIYVTESTTALSIEACTFANNTIGATHVIHTESDLSINDSIIAEPGTLALDYSGNPANLVVNYVLSNDITTLPGNGTGVIPGTPTFVDLTGGDYHLKATSLGIDFAPIPSGNDMTFGIDLDGNPRNTDLPSAGNVFGIRDLGAYERQNLFRECGTTDSIFCDGFDHP